MTQGIFWSEFLLRGSFTLGLFESESLWLHGFSGWKMLICYCLRGLCQKKILHRIDPGECRAPSSEGLLTLAPGWISPLCRALSGSTTFGAVYTSNGLYVHSQTHSLVPSMPIGYPESRRVANSQVPLS